MYFGLEFAEGFIFGRVLERSIYNYRPLAIIDETGAAVNLAAQGVSGDNLIKDPRQSSNTAVGGDKMNATWRNKPHIWHGSFGIMPPNMQFYIRYPAKSGAIANPPMNGLPTPQPSSGDHLSKMDGDDSPYADPTNFVEMVIIPNQNPSITIFNDQAGGTGTDFGADSERPVINALFAHYVFDALKPLRNARAVAPSLQPEERNRAKVNNRLIRKIVMGDYDPILKFFQAGFGEQLITYEDLLKTSWGVEPISMDDAKALEEI